MWVVGVSLASLTYSFYLVNSVFPLNIEIIICIFAGITYVVSGDFWLVVF